MVALEIKNLSRLRQQAEQMFANIAQNATYRHVECAERLVASTRRKERHGSSWPVNEKVGHARPAG